MTIQGFCSRWLLYKSCSNLTGFANPEDIATTKSAPHILRGEYPVSRNGIINEASYFCLGTREIRFRISGNPRRIPDH